MALSNELKRMIELTGGVIADESEASIPLRTPCSHYVSPCTRPVTFENFWQVQAGCGLGLWNKKTLNHEAEAQARALQVSLCLMLLNFDRYCLSQLFQKEHQEDVEERCLVLRGGALFSVEERCLVLRPP